MQERTFPEEYRVVCSREPIPECEREELLCFVNRCNTQEKGNITRMTEEILKRLEGRSIILRLFRNRLVGFVAAIIIPLDGRKTTYTTYLCLDPEIRGAHLTPLLISRLIEEGGRIGIRTGYFLIPDSELWKSPTYPIRSWYRVLDVGLARKLGFTLPFSGIPGSSRERLYYRVPTPNTSVRKVEEGDYAIVLSCLQIGGYQSPSPSSDEWSSFRSIFDLYLVFRDRDPIGLFGFFPLPVFLSRAQREVSMSMLSLVRGPVLSEALWIGQKEGFPVIYGNLLPPLTEEQVEKNRGLITNTTNYLGFFGKITSEKFSLPMI